MIRTGIEQNYSRITEVDHPKRGLLGCGGGLGGLGFAEGSWIEAAHNTCGVSSFIHWHLRVCSCYQVTGAVKVYVLRG